MQEFTLLVNPVNLSRCSGTYLYPFSAANESCQLWPRVGLRSHSQKASCQPVELDEAVLMEMSGPTAVTSRWHCGGWWAVGPIPLYLCRLDRRMLSLKGFSRLAHLKAGENVPAGRSSGLGVSLTSWPLLPNKANLAAIAPFEKKKIVS